MKTIVLFLASALVMLHGCGTKSIATHYSYKTECMGAGLDGSQTLKTWGSGINAKEAIEQAKKNAIRDVLFKGILDGKQECNTKPLVLEVNAQKKHESYFHAFFAGGGAYQEYLSEPEKKRLDITPKDRMRSKDRVTQGLIVYVHLPELKRRLIQDGIIKEH